MRRVGVPCAVEVQGQEGEDDDVQMTMDDDNVVYPKPSMKTLLRAA
jgi:hypothetical protein